MNDIQNESLTRKFRWKRLFAGIGAALALAALGAAAWVLLQVRAFDASMEKRYDVPIPELVRATDPARGKHLAESVGGCATSECHGSDLAGGRTIEMGPLGTMTGPNITPAGLSAAYSDGEMARLIQHGIKRDGTSVTFMPSHEIGWLPGTDVAAIIAYLRSVPAVQKANGPVKVGIVGKVLDRQNRIPLDVARRIDHSRATDAPLVAEPTARYGAYLARRCTGCHGDTLSGGPIPGAPSSMAVPPNLTPHETGLASWSYDDFSKLLDTGLRPDGRKLLPIMPYEALSKMDPTERTALWTYLRELTPKPLGGR